VIENIKYSRLYKLSIKIGQKEKAFYMDMYFEKLHSVMEWKQVLI